MLGLPDVSTKEEKKSRSVLHGLLPGSAFYWQGPLARVGPVTQAGLTPARTTASACFTRSQNSAAVRRSPALFDRSEVNSQPLTIPKRVERLFGSTLFDQLTKNTSQSPNPLTRHTQRHRPRRLQCLNVGTTHRHRMPFLLRLLFLDVRLLGHPHLLR